MLKLSEVKGHKLPYVIDYITTTKKVGLWNIEERSHGFYQAVFVNTHAGVTIREIRVLFNDRNQACAVNDWEEE